MEKERKTGPTIVRGKRNISIEGWKYSLRKEKYISPVCLPVQYCTSQETPISIPNSYCCVFGTG